MLVEAVVTDNDGNVDVIEGNAPANNYRGFTERVAQRINAYKKDYTRIEGYTVVVAHAWSIGVMDYIGLFVEALDDSVELVTVGEMVDMVTRYVPHNDVTTLDDIAPGDIQELAAISSEQYRWQDTDTPVSSERSFLFTSASDLGGWQLGNAGFQYDKATFDSWGKLGRGSIKLEGSDMNDAIDPIPNA